MSDIDWHWTYSKGDPVIDMGFMNHYRVKKQLIDAFGDENVDVNDEGKMYFKHFVRFAFQFPHLHANKNMTKAEFVFKRLTGDRGYLTKDCVGKLSREQLKMLIRLVEAPHGIVTDGQIKIVARPRDRHLYEDNEDNPVERKKMIEAAELDPKRHQHIYRRLMGMDDDEGDDGMRRLEHEDENDRRRREKEDEDDDDEGEKEKEGENDEEGEGEGEDEEGEKAASGEGKAHEEL